jgi:tetratricopeptide (TPR) repeat protein
MTEASGFTSRLVRKVVADPQSKDVSHKRVIIALLVTAVAGAVLFWCTHQVADHLSTEPHDRVVGNLEPGTWIVREGGYRFVGGHVIGTGGSANVLVMRQRLAGPTSIECTGRVPSGMEICDLSLRWYPDVTLSVDGATAVAGDPALSFQVGGSDNTWSGIMDHQGPVVAEPFRLDPARNYRIRAEIDGTRARLLVDGKMVCEYHRELPLPAGHWALYSFYEGKDFSDVTVTSRVSPPEVNPVMVADRLASYQLMDAAADEYARLADERSDQSDEALRLREALCLDLAGRTREADQCWLLLAKGPYAQRTALRQLEQRWKSDPDLDALLAELGRIYQSGDADLRFRVAVTWSDWQRSLTYGSHSMRQLASLVDSWYSWAHAEPLLNDAVVNSLLALRREEDVMKTDVVWARSVALVRMGQADKALALESGKSPGRANAFAALGRWDEAIASAPHWLVPWLLIRAGRYDVLMRDWQSQPAAIAESWLVRGNYDEFFKIPEAAQINRARAFCALDRYPEALDIAKALPNDQKREILLRCGHTAEAAAIDMADPALEQTLRACQAWDGLAERGFEADALLAPVPDYRWLFDDPDQCRLRWMIAPCASVLAAPPLPGIENPNPAPPSPAPQLPSGTSPGMPAPPPGVMGGPGGMSQSVQKTVHDHAWLVGQLNDAVTTLAPIKGLAVADEVRTLLAQMDKPDTATGTVADGAPPSSWLVAALGADLAGKAGPARAAYHHYILAMPMGDPALQRFAVWRIAALSSTPATP